jgi:hypothetical protein
VHVRGVRLSLWGERGRASGLAGRVDGRVALEEQESWR